MNKVHLNVIIILRHYTILEIFILTGSLLLITLIHEKKNSMLFFHGVNVLQVNTTCLKKLENKEHFMYMLVLRHKTVHDLQLFIINLNAMEFGLSLLFIGHMLYVILLKPMNKTKCTMKMDN